MDKRLPFIAKLLDKQTTEFGVSINDLRDKEFSGVKLTNEEKTALENFDRYRLHVLNAEMEKDKFHYHYRQLQVIANLSDWQEFLNQDVNS